MKYGARPFAYEIRIATHLMHNGWDVEFMEYSGAARFDLLARQGTVEIEVECKSTSGDTGRKIHREQVNRLADLVLPTTERLADMAGCHRILVTIPDRLGKSNEALSAIASVVASVAQQKGSASNELAHVEYTFDDIAAWPQPWRDPEAISFFEQRFGIPNANLLFHGRADFSVVAVMIRSAKADGVVEAIANAAKKGADQCSGTRPALLALHLIDEISRPELQAMLTTPNGFSCRRRCRIQERKAAARRFDRVHGSTVDPARRYGRQVAIRRRGGPEQSAAAFSRRRSTIRFRSP